MPSVVIEVRRQYSREQEIDLIHAVHEALIDALNTPVWEKNIRLLVHEPHRFATPPGKSESYTIVSIDLFKGHSIDSKRRLYQAIVSRVAPFGIPANEINILLRESALENWGIRGGQPASEVDLGFGANV